MPNRACLPYSWVIIFGIIIGSILKIIFIPILTNAKSIYFQKFASRNTSFHNLNIFPVYSYDLLRPINVNINWIYYLIPLRHLFLCKGKI